MVERARFGIVVASDHRIDAWRKTRRKFPVRRPRLGFAGVRDVQQQHPSLPSQNKRVRLGGVNARIGISRIIWPGDREDQLFVKSNDGCHWETANRSQGLQYVQYSKEGMSYPTIDLTGSVVISNDPQITLERSVPTPDTDHPAPF